MTHKTHPPEMTYIEQAIKKAIDGGWKPFIWSVNPKIKSVGIGQARFRHTDRGDISRPVAELFLDPSFWQSLGKAEKWGCPIPSECGAGGKCSDDWKDFWHRFIDHLAEGKTAEEFFRQLT